MTLLIVELLIARFGLYILLLRLYMLFDQEFLFLAVRFEVLVQSHAEQFLFLSMFFATPAGFNLVGDRRRSCVSSGGTTAWTGSVPTCQR